MNRALCRWWCCYDDSPRPPATEWFPTEDDARRHAEHVLRHGAQWAHVGQRTDDPAL